ncbi:MAG: hypothetical protein UU51_C0016G0006 [Microgenomates group bacterium GW2011_GWC1_41_20]|uniref:Uncharacterized protein n=7 Tax=Candidatus Woeseibacteriota TaxID=1752722 RepID=A0A0G0V075_9BACT|nr:MAG: hypothetical protein UT76_C0009G0009 [Candidatus Woesebacteria bacterium GW2011_GWB1_40_12]KKR55962.1 MAG: hypothetical protein UT93_C0009G0005 [Candidatus Woesebacteria bacterium GW2011_GWF1_40_24]KKR90918.1 MAG: hypothetical protein UU39_C0004G0003 [Candidatus Woesebacteria bacterium GW2011_GWD1_41_12]KKS00172.1 MAG: hypothetical protein UU51_C0016G0006 [Microgenomates group bacterium GW2011_GWC1_41_20]KKS05474.1 MAG: hypothetical protein UU57_C0005G0003 [Candidatus Woesebacteria bact
MPATPEYDKGEPQITERKEEFIVPETLQQSTGIQVVQKNFKAQVRDDHGQPLIQTPPPQVITVTPPADDTTLTDWSKGSTASSLTWLAAFWIRIIKKAMYFGWKIVGKEKVNAT